MKKLYFLFVVLVFACSKPNESIKTTKDFTSNIRATAETNFNNSISLQNAINDNQIIGPELAVAINNHDILSSETTLQEISNDIANFYSLNYNIDLRLEFENDDTRIILLGMIEEVYNNYVSSPSSSDLGCFFTAVSTFIGVPQARNIWKSIVSGSYNMGTVIDALKLLGKRVAGVITVAIMVYNVGECLGWWVAEPIDMSEAESPTNINAIPIDFFLGSEEFNELHYSNILNFLYTNYGLNAFDASQLITIVINNNGDPAYVGTEMITEYFNQDI